MAIATRRTIAAVLAIVFACCVAEAGVLAQINRRLRAASTIGIARMSRTLRKGTDALRFIESAETFLLAIKAFFAGIPNDFPIGVGDFGGDTRLCFLGRGVFVVRTQTRLFACNEISAGLTPRRSARSTTIHKHTAFALRIKFALAVTQTQRTFRTIRSLCNTSLPLQFALPQKRAQLAVSTMFGLGDLATKTALAVVYTLTLPKTSA
jgi:hypothetical protein